MVPTEQAVEPVVIVGAGHAGLCVASSLAGSGLLPLVLDSAEQIGDTWRDRYRALRLNTDRTSSSIPGVPPPVAMDRWPSAAAWADYLANAARSLDIDRRRARVLSVRSEGPLWWVETDRGTMLAATVVMATGRDRLPVMPRWPGDDRTDVVIQHAASFRRVADFSGKRVLVVGSGNSGTEIARLLTRRARWVGLSMRTRPLFVRREILGMAITQWGRLAKRFPASVAERFLRAMQRAIFGDLTSLGLAPAEIRLRDLAHTRGPTVDSGFIASAASGAIEILGDVDRIDATSVTTVDGDLRATDVLIAATGYRPGLEEFVAGHLLDEKGFPLVTEAPFEAAPGLFFAGFGPATLTAFMPDFAEQASIIAEAVLDRS